MIKRKKHPLIDRIYILKGADEEQVRRVIGGIKIRVKYVDEIPRSFEIGEQKLREERAIMVLRDRPEKFVKKFDKIPEGRGLFSPPHGTSGVRPQNIKGICTDEI